MNERQILIKTINSIIEEIDKRIEFLEKEAGFVDCPKKSQMLILIIENQKIVNMLKDLIINELPK